MATEPALNFGQTNGVGASSLQVAEGRATTRNPVVVELPPPILTSQTQFEIPFRTDDLNGRLVEVQLYVSTDLGENWNLYARQSPHTPRIPFASVGDGEYLFALKTLDRDGRLLPTGPPIPTLRIIVDTVRPEMLVQVEPDKMGRLAVTWRATDQNLDKTSLSLSFRAEGPSQPTEWYPLPTGSPVTEDQAAEPRWYQDRVTWQPDTTADAIVLKAEIKDQAGNITTQYQPVSLGSLVNRRPAPLLQGAQAGTLAPPDPSRIGPKLSQTTSPPGSLDRPDRLVSNPSQMSPAAPQGVPPIDWPASGGSAGGQTVSGFGGQALPVQWRRGTNPTASSRPGVVSGTTSDPFQQLLSPEAVGRPEDIAGQNLAIAVGSTLRSPVPRPDMGDANSPEMMGGTNLGVGSEQEMVGGTDSERPGASRNGAPSLVMDRRAPDDGRALSGPPASLLGGGPAAPPSGLPVDSASLAGADQSNTPATEQAINPLPGQPTGQPTRGPGPLTRPATTTAAWTGTAFRVNALQFRLRYQVDGLLPEQIGSVTIFGSRDEGATWELWTTDADKQSPAEIAVPAAGRYAFRVVVTSVTGSSSHIPRPGDQPEILVEADLDPPSPRIVAVPYGRDPRQASLQIQWNCGATDLGPTPIALAYSDQVAGPWTSITDATANSGQFDWALQPNLPQQVYLRIVVTDLAGNRGGHILEQPIDIGPLLPKGRILGIDR